MAYIGVDPNIGDITFQTFTGTGSATAFTLAQSVVSGEALLVTIGNVVQEPGTSKAYTAQGNTLTFSAAPANGDVITVRFFGRAVDQPTSYAMQLFKYVATNNQTAFTGADANGAILAFSGDDVDVYLNGVHLDSSDFTASNGNTITLGTGAATNDELVIRAYRAFTVTDTVSKASGGTFAGSVGFSGGATFPDSAELVFGTGSDFKISHNGSKTKIEDTGTGNLEIRGTNIEFYSGDGGETLAKLTDDGAAELYHNNTKRIETTSTGVDVVGDGKFQSSGSTKLNIRHTASGDDYGYIFRTTGATTNDLIVESEVNGTATERMRIDSSGHVQIQCNNSTGDLLWKEGTTDVWAIKTNGANSHLAFYDDYNNAERMRIANSGEVIIGATTQGASNCLRLDGNGTVMLVRVQNASDGTLRNGILFRNASDSTVGVIQVNNSSTNYATSSDYRLKEAVVNMTGAIDRVKALAPKRFNFIVDPDRTVDGFLAHEAQAVVPEAITGTKDEVDDDGNAVMQGIDQSKLVPLLTGALQEAIAKIETLETKVAALEAAE